MITTAHYIYKASVTYDDLGPDGLLSRAGLLRILQETAAIASDDVGYGLKDITRTGVHWILCGWRLEMVTRSPWRSELEVETWPRSIEGFMSERDFLVWDVTGGERHLAARGTSKWFLVNVETGKITRVTEQVRSAYEMDKTVLFQDPLPSNGKSPVDAAVAFQAVIGRRDIDTNLHVNNICYLDYAVESLPEEVYQNLPNTVDIIFRKQILFGTAIRCLYSFTEDGKHLVEIRSGQDGNTVHHAYIWFYKRKSEGKNDG